MDGERRVTINGREYTVTWFEGGPVASTKVDDSRPEPRRAGFWFHRGEEHVFAESDIATLNTISDEQLVTLRLAAALRIGHRLDTSIGYET